MPPCAPSPLAADGVASLVWSVARDSCVAARAGHAATVAALVGAGAALDARSRHGLNAVMFACQCASPGGIAAGRRCVKALLAGLSPDSVATLVCTRDSEGWTALHYVRCP